MYTWTFCAEIDTITIEHGFCLCKRTWISILGYCIQDLVLLQYMGI